MLTRQHKLSGTTCEDSKIVSLDITPNGQAASPPNGPAAAPPTQTKKSLWPNIKGIYVEFCANTSIHGFQYFGQQRPWKEIIFWMSIFVVSIYFCASIIVKIYVKWDETPVIVSFSERSTPLWNIPFPAVTICPETKRAKKATDPFFNDLLQELVKYVDGGQSNFTFDHLNETLALLQICDSLDIAMPSLGLPPVDYIKNLNKMLPDSQKYFKGCRWFGKEAKCDGLFTKVYTDEGICFTFNSLRGSDLYRENTFQHQVSLKHSSKLSATAKPSLNWSLEQGYDRHSDLKTYPARVLSSGSTAGLITVLQTFDGEIDSSCSYVSEGYKILLHSPDDVPSVSKHFVRIGMDKEILIAVKPKMITTSTDVAAYQPQKRQCYLNMDRHLKFYKVYSQNNCVRECLTNFTLSQCGCVKFSMPRTPAMPVCGQDKISCYTRAREQLFLKQFSEGLRKRAKFTSGDKTACDCMPACTSLEYETEISEGNIKAENIQKAFHLPSDTDAGTKMSIVKVYFKENQFITSRRSELYGVTELLANFGGVCGLFMGISILSIVEMLYHFTLRLWSNVTGPRANLN